VIADFRLAAQSARGTKEGAAAIGAVLRAAGDGALDLTHTRVAGDWVQYRQNFRQPIVRRAISGGRTGDGMELAFDLRRADESEVDAQLAAALAGTAEQGVIVEDWAPISRSCVWRFNALYWTELGLWEEVSGKGYAQALPGGESQATNSAQARGVILELFRIWDRLVEQRALPDQLTVLELGVGNGDQARVWLDEFARLDREQGRDYYRRLHYLMGDYSTLVLDLARANTTEHRARVSTLVLDAARPRETLRFLEGKVFFVYVSNVYDNLPTDELAYIDDVLYQVETRPYLPTADAERIAAGIDVPLDGLSDQVQRLLRLGPRLLAESSGTTFPDSLAATRFWQEVWAAIRVEERYVPLGPSDQYLICEGVSGEMLEPLADGFGDVRFHVSNGAAASFLDTLPLLHPLGLFTCLDLFVTDLEQYRTGYRGPGKYDGSTVNWVNGPILRATAARLGYHLEFGPLSQESRSPVSVATARARD
jgi:hypothetical protein